jgi:hypothetical protein
MEGVGVVCPSKKKENKNESEGRKKYEEKSCATVPTSKKGRPI